MISCKKSDKYLWAFLTRKVKETDPNIDPLPIEYITNSGILKIQQSERKFKDYVLQYMNSDQTLVRVHSVTNNIFAFQEIDEVKGVPQNDRNIYESVISSIKAMEYEKKAALSRKKQPVVYLFHLVSVFCGNMVEVDMSDNLQIDQSNHLKYLNRFIIDNKEGFHIVHFVSRNVLDEVVSFFDDYHKINVDLHKQYIDHFRKNFLQEYAYRNLFRVKIEHELLQKIRSHVRWIYRFDDIEIPRIHMFSDEKYMTLRIALPVENDEIIERLNSDEQLMSDTESVLQKLARYSGRIIYVKYDEFEDIPF